MSFALSIDPAAHLRAAPPSAPRNLLDELLREQQSTAVEKFSQWHERDARAAAGPLLPRPDPASRAKPGEQYAFEVDLDACSGCKACVAACHNLNGLDEDETWRSVGLLHGGTSESAGHSARHDRLPSLPRAGLPAWLPGAWPTRKTR